MTVGWADRQTDEQTDSWADRKIDRWAEWTADKQATRYTNLQTEVFVQESRLEYLMWPFTHRLTFFHI